MIARIANGITAAPTLVVSVRGLKSGLMVSPVGSSPQPITTTRSSRVVALFFVTLCHKGKSLGRPGGHRLESGQGPLPVGKENPGVGQDGRVRSSTMHLAMVTAPGCARASTSGVRGWGAAMEGFSSIWHQGEKLFAERCPLKLGLLVASLRSWRSSAARSVNIPDRASSKARSKLVFPGSMDPIQKRVRKYEEPGGLKSTRWCRRDSRFPAATWRQGLHRRGVS